MVSLNKGQRERGGNRKRREFCAITISGLAGATFLSSIASEAPGGTEKTYKTTDSGIKLAVSHIFYPDLTDEMLGFMNQLGLDGIEGWVSGEYATYEHIVRFREQVEKAGLTLFEVGLLDTYNSDEIILALPARDDTIQRYQEFIRNLGRAGIERTIYAWCPGGVYRTGSELTRGCITGAFDTEVYKKKPLLYNRKFSDEELWDNYIYFMKRILPVAEDSGVKMALHPGDPPISFNIPRLFRSTEGYKRAMDISNNSPYSGILFCVGCFAEMEGPEGKGEDIVGAIHHFGKAGKIFEVHFRNVSAPLPHFHETFIDNGYIDMYQVMKALRDVNFSGAVVPDHVPSFKDEKRLGSMGVSGTPYSMGYMRALLHALSEQV